MKVEDIATELYELVQDRKTVKEILDNFNQKSTITYTPASSELQDAVRKYKDSRKGLEGLAEKIKKTYFPAPAFPDPLDFGDIDFGASLQRSVQDLIAQRQAQQSKPKLNTQQDKDRLNRAKGKVKKTFWNI